MVLCCFTRTGQVVLLTDSQILAATRNLENTYISVVYKLGRGETPLVVHPNLCDLILHVPGFFFPPNFYRIYFGVFSI